MATEVINTAYILELKFPALDYATKDMLNIYIIRMPLQKMANITKVTVPIPTSVLLTIENKVTNKEFIDATITFNLTDIEAVSTTRSYPEQFIRLNQYNLLSIKTVQAATLINKIPLVELTLVNNLCFNLSKTHLFNQVFTKYDEEENINEFQGIRYPSNPYYDNTKLTYKPKMLFSGSPREVLSIFEGNTRLLNTIVDKYMAFLINTYGDFSVGIDFSFSYSDYYNNHDYEQILVNSKSDLQVMKFLWSKYKLFNSPGYIFFDDFASDNQQNNFETMLRSSVFSWTEDGNLLNDTDVNDFQEIKIGTRLLNRYPYNDISDNLNFSNPEDTTTQYIIETPEDNIYSNADNTHNELFVESISSVQIANVSDESRLGKNASKRQKSEIKVQQQNPNIVPNQTIKIKSPDSRANAIDRIKKSNKVSSNQIRAIVEYECPSAHFSLIDFNRIYNFDILSPYAFIYEPVSIVNVFSKVDNRDTKMKHIAKFQCIEHNNPDSN